MSDSYSTDTQHFQTIADFLRFGLSQANMQPLHFGHGTDNAWDDILTLVLGCLKLPHDVSPVLLHARLTDSEKAMLCEQLEQRILARVPVPYLTNEAHFCDLTFYVDERVLIPRSPIAELIRHQFAPWIEEDEVGRVLDMCTGSACIAIACCEAFPEALVDAVDISPEALMVAEINRKRHGVQDQLTLILRCAPSYLSDHGILVVEVGNSEQALADAYPHVPFTWLDFEHGGQGVFLLTAQQVNEYFGCSV